MATDRPASTAAKLPHSRLCTSLQSRPATEQPYLFEALRELAFETCLDVAGATLRVGLAASAWQLEQARQLLEHFQPVPGQKLNLPPASLVTERAVALALQIAPRHGKPRAQGVITLRCDSAAGLALDRHHHETLEQMRAEGARLVEVEQLAFDRQAPLLALIKPMLQVLSSPVKTWEATDILAECTRLQAAFYCGQLGFKRLQNRPPNRADKILLHLPSTRLVALQSRHLPEIRRPD